MFGSELLRGVDRTPQALRIDWDSGDPFTIDELRELFLRKDFEERILKALYLSDVVDVSSQTVGREYGFVGYRMAASPDRNVVLSPLFSGEPRSIDLSNQAAKYQSENLPDSLFDYLAIHSHGGILLDYSNMLRYRYKPAYEQATLKLRKIFSLSDLKHFHWRSRDRTSAIIHGVLFTDDESKGKLILASFRDFEGYKNFNPSRVFGRSVGYIYMGEDPCQAYEEAGLNVGIVKINPLRPHPINRTDVDRVSHTLTTRY